MNKPYSKNDILNKTSLLGVGFSTASRTEILEFIIRGLEKNDEKYYVVTPNPELLVIANKNLQYKKVLNNAKLALIDGVGVLFGGKILGEELEHRFAGVDLLESLCKEVSKQPITVGFLGAGPGVAELAAECLREKFPGLNIVFTESGNPDSKTVELIRERFLKNGEKTSGKTGNMKGIDILFVAFGSPKQEFWIAENLDRLPVKVAIGVGGAFDFISGKVKRAPAPLRNMGLEWLFRLLIQPWRIKRQLSLVVFMLLILKQRISPEN